MRWIVRIVGAILVLVLLAVAALFLLPSERIAAIATDRFEAATGRAMTVSGQVRPTLWPVLGVRTGEVRIANADWAETPDMVTAEALAVGVDAGALLRGDIRIVEVTLRRPTIALERAADGRGNWELASQEGADAGGASGAASGDAGGSPLSRVSFEAVTLEDADIGFVDRAGGGRTRLTGLDATLSMPDPGGSLSVEATATLNGAPLSLNATVDGLAAALEAGAGAVPVRIDAALGSARLAFVGLAGMAPPAAKGRIEANLPDLGATLAALGPSVPGLAADIGRAAAVSGEVTYTGDTLNLRGARLALDGNAVTGDIDVALSGERPRVVANLTAGALDFSALAADGGEAGSGGSGGAEAGGGWSTAPIDASALHLVDAEVSLLAESLDFGLTRLGRTRLRTSLDAGRAVTDVRELSAFDGNVEGQVIVNARGGLSSRINLSGRSIALRPLLTQFAGFDRLITKGDMAINVLGVGNSMAALMGSLTGEGAIRFGAGEMLGLDLVGMLRTLDPGFMGEGTKTIFDSITATFRIENGVVTNADLQFLAPLLSATGKGRISLADRTLDYTLTPRLLEGQNGGIAVPITFRGSWSSPKISVDFKAAATAAATAGGIDVEKVKEDVRTRVEDRVREELGISGDTSEGTPEDLIRRGIEGGLRDLLGGGRNGNGAGTGGDAGSASE